MKTSRRTKNASGLGLVLTLALVLGSPASAQTRPAGEEKTDSPPPKPAACVKCKTEAHEEFSVTKVGDEWVSRTTGIGTKHTCDTCGGRITQVGGQTHNAMMDYCATCAKARPECCKIESHRNPADS